jgi:predicted RNase H-like HicB family nuclease
MRKLTYLAVFEPYDGGFSVYFPDLSGCISMGDDFEQAQKNAKEALNLHIYGMEKDGDTIPQPSKAENLKIAEETQKNYIITSITIYPEMFKNEMDNKAVKTNVTIPAWLKEMAELEHANFSAILQNGLREYLHL